MLDINFVREHKDEVKENSLKRKADVDIDKILVLDDQRRKVIQELDGLRAQMNVASKQKPSEEEIVKLRETKEKISLLEDDLKVVEADLNTRLSFVPNMSASDMPEGKGEEDNVEVKVWIPQQGYLSEDKLGKGNNAAQYMPTSEGLLHHQDLGEKLDIIDNKQSALVSGSRFVYLKNEAVLLQYALQQLLTGKLLEEGFSPMIPPILVKERVLFGTSHFPEGKDQVYKIEANNIEDQQELFLVGSSEPPLFAYYMDKTLREEELPKKMFAMTTCFRSEVGSWGKDVRGIKRVHQFDKLEMDAVTSQEQSEDVMNQLLAINEWLLQQLQIPYRVVYKCTGDCGYSATFKQYDIEAWLPGQKEFMEVMTDTNAADYQARRLNIKYQPKAVVGSHNHPKDSQKKLAHTVNDTGVAMGRMIVAILDNYQQKDGSVKVPEVLIPFTKFSEISPKR